MEISVNRCVGRFVQEGKKGRIMQNLDTKKYSIKTLAKLYRFRWPRQDRDSEQHAEIDLKHTTFSVSRFRYVEDDEIGFEKSQPPCVFV